MTSVAEVLERAADLIEPEGAWTQKSVGRDAEGQRTLPESIDAVRWCMWGAVQAVAQDRAVAWRARCVVVRQVREWFQGRYSVEDWNDVPGRQQSEVVAALRTAARHARTAEENA